MTEHNLAGMLNDPRLRDIVQFAFSEDGTNKGLTVRGLEIPGAFFVKSKLSFNADSFTSSGGDGPGQQTGSVTTLLIGWNSQRARSWIWDSADDIVLSFNYQGTQRAFALNSELLNSVKTPLGYFIGTATPQQSAARGGTSTALPYAAQGLSRVIRDWLRLNGVADSDISQVANDCFIGMMLVFNEDPGSLQFVVRKPYWNDRRDDPNFRSELGAQLANAPFSYPVKTIGIPNNNVPAIRSVALSAELRDESGEPTQLDAVTFHGRFNMKCGIFNDTPPKRQVTTPITTSQTPSAQTNPATSTGVTTDPPKVNPDVVPPTEVTQPTQTTNVTTTTGSGTTNNTNTPTSTPTPTVTTEVPCPPAVCTDTVTTPVQEIPLEGNKKMVLKDGHVLIVDCETGRTLSCDKVVKEPCDTVVAEPCEDIVRKLPPGKYRIEGVIDIQSLTFLGQQVTVDFCEKTVIVVDSETGKKTPVQGQINISTGETEVSTNPKPKADGGMIRGQAAIRRFRESVTNDRRSVIIEANPNVTPPNSLFIARATKRYENGREPVTITSPTFTKHITVDMTGVASADVVISAYDPSKQLFTPVYTTKISKPL